MKTQVIAFAAAVACCFSASLSVCANASPAPSDNDMTMTPSVSGYDEVKISGEFRVKYCNPSEVLRIVASRNVLDDVECFVKDNELVVKFIKGQAARAILSGKSPIVYIPASADIEKIELNGACKFECEYPIEGDEFEFEVAGAATIKADVKVRKLDVDCSGAASVTVTGTAEKLDLDISGASKVNAIEGFECTRTEIDMSGSSVVKVNCTEKISGEISGASIVKYHGSPAVSVHTSGVSNISEAK